MVRRVQPRAAPEEGYAPEFLEGLEGYRKELYNYARALTGGNGSLADDLVQDTMLNALGAYHLFEPGSNLRAWLLTILSNRFKSQRKRRFATHEILVGDEALQQAAIQPPQEWAVLAREFVEAYARLRPHHQEALMLARVRGLPYQAIARQTGCAVSTVKTRVFRATEKLAAHMDWRGKTKGGT